MKKMCIIRKWYIFVIKNKFSLIEFLKIEWYTIYSVIILFQINQKVNIYFIGQTKKIVYKDKFLHRFNKTITVNPWL